MAETSGLNRKRPGPVTTEIKSPLAQCAPLCDPQMMYTHFNAEVAMKGDSATSRATVTPAGFVESEIASVIEGELYDTASRFQRGVDPQRVLADNGLHKFFSSAASRLCPSEPPIRDAAIAPLHEYFAHLRVLHQIVAICSQLQTDVRLSNHKYIAHQVALLYQSLNQAKLPFDTFKKSIESRFEALKAVTEQSQHPILPESHRQWLLTVTTDLLQNIAEAPRPLTKKIQPWLDVIRRNGT